METPHQDISVIMKRRNTELDKTLPPGIARRTVTPVASKVVEDSAVDRDGALQTHNEHHQRNPKRLKLASTQPSSCSFRMGKGAASPMDQNEFTKLDMSNSQHARRVSQRRKMIATGKASLSYSLYRQKVPKDQRKPRSMITPTTPDHTLDIPNKRWQGMVRAWRRALHKYDNAEDKNDVGTNDKETVESRNEIEKIETVQDHELATAQANGLLVDVSTTGNESDVDTTSNGEGIMEELDNWDVSRQNTSNGSDLWSDDDSDDDLL